MQVPVAAICGKDAIEGRFAHLNRVAPAASRRISHWSGGEREEMFAASVTVAPSGDTGNGCFMVEAQYGFGLDVHTLDASCAPASYAIVLPVTGSVQLRQTHAQVCATAGQGLIINPAEVELTRVGAGTHFIEFTLPMVSMLRLGAELAPGGADPRSGFAPLLPSGLATRLLQMSLQAASMLSGPQQERAKRVMFERWREMLALTLLHEHPALNAPSASQLASDALPAKLQRALDYIDERAGHDILLADIANAACVSASSLLRLFQSSLGLSPGAFVRQVRLDRARAELQRGANGTVREVALRWGFENAGKFSQAYAKRFGERPSDTRARKR